MNKSTAITIAKKNNKPAIDIRVTLFCKIGIKNPAPMLVAISAGSVPRPKHSINKPPCSRLPLANDHVNAE